MAGRKSNLPASWAALWNLCAFADDDRECDFVVIQKGEAARSSMADHDTQVLTTHLFTAK